MNNFQLLPILSMLVFALLGMGTADAQDAGVKYEARYQSTGYFLRAVGACENFNKEHVGASFTLVDTDEMKAFSNAFPQTIEKWMVRGGELFNASVMRDGIRAACDRALERLKKASSSRQ